MKEFVHDENGKLIGTVERSEFAPLPPAPEGAALDVLIDEVATTIERYFTQFWDRDLQKEVDRLATVLKPTQGAHSRLLVDGKLYGWLANRFTRGIRSWIVEGTLRSSDELNPVLNAFVNTRLFERRMYPDQTPDDWKLDDYGLGMIGAEFGLPAPPSRAELAAKQVEHEAAAKERRERDAEREREMYAQMEAERAAFNTSPEGQRQARVEEVIEGIVQPPAPYDGYGSEEDHLKLERANRASEVKAVTPYVDEITKQTSYAPVTIIQRWKRAERDYLEIVESLREEYVMELAPVETFAYREVMDEYADPGTWEPYTMNGDPRPELQAGEVRLTFRTHADLVAHMRAHPETWWDVDHATVWMDEDRSFVLDYLVGA